MASKLSVTSQTVIPSKKGLSLATVKVYKEAVHGAVTCFAETGYVLSKE